MTNAERNRQAANFIWSGLIVATVVLLSRRIGGGMNSLSSSGPCVTATTIMMILSGIAWALFQAMPITNRSLRGEQIATAVAELPILLSGLALLPPDSSFARGWLMGVTVLSASVIALTGRWSRVAVSSPSVMANPQVEFRDVRDRPFPPAELQYDAAEPELGVFNPVQAESDGTTTQWMTRQMLADGGESLEGSIRVSFGAGQRSASVHVPFVPPFASVPQVDCEITSDGDVRWKVSVVYAYGMRVELKRDDHDHAAEIEIGYSAICEPAANAA